MDPIGEGIASAQIIQEQELKDSDIERSTLFAPNLKSYKIFIRLSL